MVRVSTLSLGNRWLKPWPSQTKELKKKMVRAASLIDVQHLKRIEHGQTMLGRQWQTSQYKPCQENALAAPTLYNYSVLKVPYRNI